MEEKAIQQLKVILERQGAKVDAVESLPPMEKALVWKMGDYYVLLSRKSKLAEKDVKTIIKDAYSAFYPGAGAGEEEKKEEEQVPSNFILVTLTKPSMNVEGVVRVLIMRKSVRMYFHIKELQYDITQHRMFPPHFLFSDEFKKANPKVLEQFNRYRMKDPINELPRMDCLDIGARLIGARPGDVVYIQRHSDTVGIAPMFRRVVENASVDQ